MENTTADRRMTNFNIVATRLIVCAILLAIPIFSVLFLPAYDRRDFPEGWFFLGAVVFTFVLTYFTVFWIEFGDHLTVRYIWRTRKLEWNQIKSVSFGIHETELSYVVIGRHLMFSVRLKKGLPFQIKVKPETASQIEEFMKAHALDHLIEIKKRKKKKPDPND